MGFEGLAAQPVLPAHFMNRGHGTWRKQDHAERTIAVRAPLGNRHGSDVLLGRTEPLVRPWVCGCLWDGLGLRFLAGGMAFWLGRSCVVGNCFAALDAEKPRRWPLCLRFTPIDQFTYEFFMPADVKCG